MTALRMMLAAFSAALSEVPQSKLWTYTIVGFDKSPYLTRTLMPRLAGALWPLFAVLGVLWLLRAFARGVAQVWRLFVPARVKLPKAQVHR